MQLEMSFVQRRKQKYGRHRLFGNDDVRL